MTTRNEAAVRLREAIWTAPYDLGLYVKDLDAALAAAKAEGAREAVERIRARLSPFGVGDGASVMNQAVTIALAEVHIILDEEAAR